MIETGGCQCGAVAYTITGDDPLHVYVCHCLNCQTRSGSAFGEHAMLPASAFACAGPTAVYIYTASGVEFEEVVCAACHTRLYNLNSALPGMIFLRAGTLSGSDRLQPMAHIWTKRKQPWITIPDDILCFEESPTPEQFESAVEKAHARRAAR